MSRPNLKLQSDSANRARIKQSLPTILKASLFLFALLSLSYAVVTAAASSSGFDLQVFQDMGRAWVVGIYQNRDGPFYGLPPHAVVLFSPLSLLSFERLKIAWLVVNLSAAALCIHLAIKIFGERWSPDARYFLAAFFLSWAPFRVTLREGQLSLIITALLLGSLLARKQNKKWLAGAMLGLALCKYPLSFAFLFYFLWKREWKASATAILVPVALTQVFAYRLGISVVEATLDYAHALGHAVATEPGWFVGVTDIKPVFLALTAGNQSLSILLSAVLSVTALILMLIAFHRRPQREDIHIAALTFFTLWSVYHRVYDSALCILPAAVLINFIIRRTHTRFGRAGLAGLALLIVSIPGLLTIRLGLNPESLSSNVAGFLGLHIERLLMFGLFWAFLTLLWKASPEQELISIRESAGFA